MIMMMMMMMVVITTATMTIYWSVPTAVRLEVAVIVVLNEDGSYSTLVEISVSAFVGAAVWR